MSNTNDADVCDVCNRGMVVRKMQEIAFHQWTSKGNVFCRVCVPTAICTECGVSHANEAPSPAACTSPVQAAKPARWFHTRYS
jgi:hypothetical protein